MKIVEKLDPLEAFIHLRSYLLDLADARLEGCECSERFFPILVARDCHVLTSTDGKEPTIEVEGKSCDGYVFLLDLSKGKPFVQTVNSACVLTFPGSSKEDTLVREDEVFDSCFGRTVKLLSQDHVTHVVNLNLPVYESHGHNQTIRVELKRADFDLLPEVQMLLSNHEVVQAPRLIQRADCNEAFQRRKANISDLFTVSSDLVDLLLTLQVPDLRDSIFTASLLEGKDGNLITFWRKFSNSHSLIDWYRF